MKSSHQVYSSEAVTGLLDSRDSLYSQSHHKQQQFLNRQKPTNLRSDYFNIKESHSTSTITNMPTGFSSNKSIN